MRQKHANRPQVGQVPQPGPALEQPHLENLARHHHFRHAVTMKVADGRAELGQPEPVEVVAHLGQRGIGVADRAQAIDFAPLPPQCLGDHDRIAAPAGQHSDATFVGRGVA